MFCQMFTKKITNKGLWFGVPAEVEVVEEAIFAVALYVTLGRTDGNLQLLGNGKKGLAVELGRQMLKENLLDDRGSR